MAQQIEQIYSSSISIEHRKQFAQFFTPIPIAEKMAMWILNNKLGSLNILEPAFGLGVFSRVLLQENPNVNITGYDIDEIIISRANDYFSKFDNVNILKKDYMLNDWDKKYDGIICNPPYFKFHDYDNKTILSEVEKNIKCQLNGFTNLYTLFLLKSLHQLSKNGRCAYIIPAEFLNSDYGVYVKKEILKTNILRHVIVINFEENVFDDAQTTASIILCSNDNKRSDVGFTCVDSVQNLGIVDDIVHSYNSNTKYSKTNYIPCTKLDPEVKWKQYYQIQNQLSFKNLVPFARYAKVVRGIATGANNYFVFNQSKANKYNIREEFLLPCISKSVDVKTSVFTVEDYQKLKEKDKGIFILNAVVGLNNENVVDFIKKGEEEDIDKKYLTSRRNPWFALENRPPSPIWVSVFNRTSGLRFVKNEAGVLNLTTFHCVYLEESSISVDLFFAYLLTQVARDIFIDNSREYGNGLTKFEPNDLNNSKVVDFELLDAKEKDYVLDNYYKYKKHIKGGQPTDNDLAAINDFFLTKFQLLSNY